MTKLERLQKLEELKTSLLKDFNSLEEAKKAKKELTKLSNKLADRANKLSKTFKDIAWKANGTFEYGDKSIMARTVWFFVSVHPYINGLVNVPDNLRIIKDDFPELHEVALNFWNDIKEDVDYIVNLTKHIDDEVARFKGTTAQQFLKLASKNSEISLEKKLAFEKYATSLKDWKEATIKDGKITVNGKTYKDGQIVGVMIGRGNRVHSMTLESGIYKDKKTNEEKEVIYISNHTQWRHSDLVILDFIENIPSELLSER